MEEWKWIPEYEGLYLVSNEGRIMSLLQSNRQPTVMVGIGSNGYKQLFLCKYGSRKIAYFHQIVAEVFVPNPDNKPCVNHKDGNKRNNNAENLEWVTYEENSQHAYSVAGIEPWGGGKRRFTEEQIRQIRSSNESGAELARRFSVTPAAIYAIRNRTSYKDVEDQ